MGKEVNGIVSMRAVTEVVEGREERNVKIRTSGEDEVDRGLETKGKNQAGVRQTGVVRLWRGKLEKKRQGRGGKKGKTEEHKS